ncbi:hypothetical protein SLS63_006599 [Diaporthe eres]|uniref:FAD-binding domain-containing protein n=1 Tax=Diaporthe eres TaxID=83184 RepID=A0ABR1P7I9_DIAER
MVDKKLHTLIIGAGMTGLLVAQGLKKVGEDSAVLRANLPFTIFEYETSTTYQSRPREWGMTLHWGSTHIDKCLPPELSARFSEAYADPSLSLDATSGLPVHNGKTGELILEMAGEKPMRVSRKKMRNLFMEGIDVQYGKSVVSCRVIEDKTDEDNGRVRVKFADGTDALGDVVVGCDGAKSVVRENIVGVEAAQVTVVPLSMFNFTQKFPAEFSKDLRIQDVPDPSAPETWTYQVIMSWIHNPLPHSENNYEGRMKFFKKRAEEWAEPWRTAGRLVKEDTKIPMDAGTYWEKARKWDNRQGRMTISGDAAHPMTPHRGQGLNNALQDSSNFVAAMIHVDKGEKTLADAIDAYDNEVLERGMLEMEISLKQTMFIHNWDTLMQSPMVKMGMHQAKKE